MTAPVTVATRTAPRPLKRQWLVPVGLIILSLIPMLAGSMRLAELSDSPAVTPDNARFVLSPIPVVAHIIGATVYTLLGAFQFVPSLRARRSWHRIAGLVLIPAGLIAALSGLWMAVFSTLPASDNAALAVIRVVFGLAMVASILLGVRAIVRRDFAAHGAWMARGYAIGAGAGTQAVIMIVPTLALGGLDPAMKATLMAAAWVINLAVAEYAIRRRYRRPRPNPR